MKTIARTPHLALWLGVTLATVLVSTGCGKKDESAQGGYVPGTEATHKGGGTVARASTIAKPVPATSATGKGKQETKDEAKNATVLPPSNTVQSQGGGNLAL